MNFLKVSSVWVSENSGGSRDPTDMYLNLDHVVRIQKHHWASDDHVFNVYVANQKDPITVKSERLVKFVLNAKDA